MTKRRPAINHSGDGQNAGTATFEYELRHLLARRGLPGGIQNSIAEQVIGLARRYLGLAADEPPRSVRKVSGSSVHYFRSSVDGIERPDDVSACGRVQRQQLSDDRATSSTTLISCGHCKTVARAEQGGGNPVPNAPRGRVSPNRSHSLAPPMPR